MTGSFHKYSSNLMRYEKYMYYKGTVNDYLDKKISDRVNKLWSIETVNDAILNIKSEDKFIRYHCKQILKGKNKK